MVDKKLLAGLTQVDQIIAQAKAKNARISGKDYVQSKKILGLAVGTLLKLKAGLEQSKTGLEQKTAAIAKSASESLITQADADTESHKVSVRKSITESRLTKVTEAIKAARTLASELMRLAASPELEAQDKGHKSDSDIKAPAKAATKQASEAPKGKEETLVNGEPVTPSTAKGRGDIQVISSQTRAKHLYTKAMALAKKAQAETSDKAKAALLSRATMFERIADKLVATKVPAVKPVQAKKFDRAALKTRIQAQAKKIMEARKAALSKKASADPKVEDKQATVVFAANDRVLLADGAVGQVKAVAGDRLTVTIGGVEREVVAQTAKRIASTPKTEAAIEAPKAETKSSSLADRIKSAVNVLRGSKKQADADKAPAPANAGPAPAPEAPVVSKSEIQGVSFNPELNKWLVTVSENEVMEFETEEAAKSYMSKEGAKKVAETSDPIIDSANPKAPASQEDVAKNLKGLDQQGKDYGTTSKEEKVNPQISVATAKNPGMPTDSVTNKAPEGSVAGQSKLKGLDQKSKDYGTTGAEQKVHPQFSAIAAKMNVLAETNKKQAERLSEVEGQLLADRAVKVGAISEDRSQEQGKILAELYRTSPSEFKAYARLLDNLEAEAAKQPNLAVRAVRKVEATLAKRQSTVIDSTPSQVSGSLESGTFFDE